MHGYVAPGHWLRALELAGFDKARVHPNLEAVSDSFPDQYAAVIVGEK